MAILRGAGRGARSDARQAPQTCVRRSPPSLAGMGRRPHCRFPAPLPERERRPRRAPVAPAAPVEPRPRQGPAFLHRVPGPYRLWIRLRARRRPDGRRVCGRGARGMACGLALPRRQRRAALDRVRRALPGPRVTTRSDRQGVSRKRAPHLPDRVARIREPSMILGATLVLLGSLATVQGDGIRLEFDGAMKSRVVATMGPETALGPFTESETLLT